MNTVATGEGNSTSLATIRVLTSRTSASLPLYVGLSQKLFEKEGLNVTMKYVQDITSVPPVLGKQFDIGFSTAPTMIRAAAQGIDVAEIANLQRVDKTDTSMLLLTPPNSGITGPKDLAGKKLAVSSVNGNINTAILEWLKQNGVDQKSVHEVQVAPPQMADQLKAGRVDAAGVFQPFAAGLLKQGYVKIGYPFGVVGKTMAFGMLMANRAWAEDHLPLLSKFTTALDAADHFMATQPDATYSILAKYTGTPSNLVKNDPLGGFSVAFSIADLNRWPAIIADVADFHQKVDLTKLIVKSK